MAAAVRRMIAWALARKPIRAYLLYSDKRGNLLADSVTYRALFSVFAALLLGLSVVGLWLKGNPQAWDAFLSAIDAAVPGLIGPDGLVDPSDASLSAGFTIAGIASLVGVVGAAIGVMGSLRAALRIIADTVASEGLIFWVMLRDLLLAAGLGVALLASAAVTFAGTAFVSVASEWLGFASGSALGEWAVRLVPLAVTFVLDSAIVAALFRVLSGVRPAARSLWPGALWGGLGLTVLQQLSGLFVGAASRNPLLASFGSLIALLIWFNLSSQVILIASAYIVTGMEEDRDRVRARFGAETFAQRSVRRAEHDVHIATVALRKAREIEAAERESTVTEEPDSTVTEEPDSTVTEEPTSTVTEEPTSTVTEETR